MVFKVGKNRDSGSSWAIRAALSAARWRNKWSGYPRVIASLLLLAYVAFRDFFYFPAEESYKVTKLKRGQYGYHFFSKNRWKLHKSQIPIEGIIASVRQQREQEWKKKKS